MMTQSVIELWVYIVLLFIGGLIGFLKAGSKMSLIMASVFAAILSLCNTFVIKNPYVVEVVLAFLLVFFTVRYVKSKKFMPNGLMTILTFVTILVRHLPFLKRLLNLG